MMDTPSESDMTSLATSSPRLSPKPAQQAVYYVQSPSRDSHEDDNTSATATQATTTPVGYTSPSDSPSLLSLFGRQTRSSSASRISGTHHAGGFRRKGRREREREGRRLLGHVTKGMDEGKESEREMYVKWWRDEDGEELTTSCKGFIGFMVLCLLFVVVCFVVWGASRPFSAHVHVKKMMVNNFYYGEGSDLTGVPTKILTINCSVIIRVHNPATFFGIHVSSSTFKIRYYGLTLASAQMKRYYQPKNSWRTIVVNIEDKNVPLYGAGAGFELSESNVNNLGVPLILEFETRTRGNVIGKLVKIKHRQRITCSFNVNSRITRIVNFSSDYCIHV